MTMRRLALPTVALSVMLAAPSSAAEKVTRISDHIRLWNDCRSVGLLVESLPDDAAKIGLRVEDIETTIRSRLRGARIYTERDSRRATSLYAHVALLKPAFNVLLEYRRTVEVQYPAVLNLQYKGHQLEITEFPLLTTVWKLGTIGTYGGDSGFILSVVARHTDKFIDEYLRVNRDSCEKRSPVR